MPTDPQFAADPMMGSRPIAHARHADRADLVAGLTAAPALVDAAHPRVEYAPTPAVTPGAKVDYVPGPNEPVPGPAPRPPMMGGGI